MDAGKNRPGWVSESLAQYYALKALRRVSGNDVSVEATWKRWFGQAAEDKGSVLEAQHRVDKKDFSHYGTFYTHGSLFWRDIDAALQRAGQADGLDSILPVILNATFPPEGSLPPEVLAALDTIPDMELKTLISTYL